MHHNSNHEVKIVRPIEANNREMETIREIKPPRNVESAGCVCGFLVILYIAGKREREALPMTYILKENYVANRKISVSTLKFDLKLSKKASKNTRAIPTVKI